ncbi:MAG: hypothetical protein H6622_17490 [Halobacteriovoraceae bacterium]|nr:hypothetical protein [Halobacteriovoraceae bacterium]
MAELNKLICIYDFRPLNNLGNYYLYYIFGHNGPVEEDLLLEEFKYVSDLDVDSYKKFRIVGPFPDVEVLKNFCLKICKSINKTSISLVMVEEYNSFIEEHHSLEGIVNNFFLIGTSFRVEGTEKRGGIFNKLFT